MNGLNGKPTEYPENALVPYPVIVVATKGVKRQILANSNVKLFL